MHAIGSFVLVMGDNLRSSSDDSDIDEYDNGQGCSSCYKHLCPRLNT